MAFNHSDVIKDLINWIENNIDNCLNIDSIASKSGYSHFYIQRVFFKVTGVPLAKYVREFRLKLAAEHLVKTNTPINKIADELGFSDQQSFTRAFRRHYKMPPGKWRRNKKH